MELQGEQIPKATMTSYLKEKLGKTKISIEFTEGILHLAKEYVTKIANKANEICTSEKKKTISLDHLYKAIDALKLGAQMQTLKKIQEDVKKDAMAKQEMKLKIQQSYDEMVKEQQEKGKPAEHAVPIRDKLNAELLEDSSQEEDYEKNEVAGDE